MLASARSDKRVILRDLDTATGGETMLIGHTGNVRALTFGQPVGEQLCLVSVGDDSTVRLWNPDTPPNLTEDNDRSHSAAFRIAPSKPISICSTGQTLIVGCSDGVIALTYPGMNAQNSALKHFEH